MKKLPIWLGDVVAFFLGGLAAFFGTFLVLFSDVFGLGQQAGAVLYVLVVYGIFSILLHWLWPGHGKAWRLWLIVPAVVVMIYVTLNDFNNYLYLLAVLAGVVGGSWIGKIVFQRNAAAIIGPARPPVSGQPS